MAKVSTKKPTVKNKIPSKQEIVPNESNEPNEILSEQPTPILSSIQIQRSKKKKYLLFNQKNEIVAVIIDKSMAEKWTTEHKRGAVRMIEAPL